MFYNWFIIITCRSKKQPTLQCSLSVCVCVWSTVWQASENEISNFILSLYSVALLRDIPQLNYYRYCYCCNSMLLCSHRPWKINFYALSIHCVVVVWIEKNNNYHTILQKRAFFFLFFSLLMLTLLDQPSQLEDFSSFSSCSFQALQANKSNIFVDLHENWLNEN